MGQVGNDMVMWSSAETGDTGMGLLDFLPNAMIERWVRESVLLNASATACSVPKGIFAAPDGAARRGDGGGASFVRGAALAVPKAAGLAASFGWLGSRPRLDD